MALRALSNWVKAYKVRKLVEIGKNQRPQQRRGDAGDWRIHRGPLQWAEETGKAGVSIPFCVCEEVLSKEDCGQGKLVSTIAI